ncbi:MAG: histidine--tRNA ligase [Patescibacteria group bacterium]|jgi:histidyl-tRNA synthetase
MPRKKGMTPVKAPAKSRLNPPQLLKGMKDILPEEQKYWNYLVEKVKNIAEAYGFERIDTPILEPTSLFIRSIGKNTDIVEKEMFSFVDQGGDHVCARPEITASIVRAYNEHGMINRPQPVKLYSIGPVFRHDKPQAGRYRQFNQYSFEVIGEASSVIDAELISLQYHLFKDLGLDSSIHINSVGCKECRPNYAHLLQEYYRSRRKNLCDNCKRRYSKNPMRLLDCKEKVCNEMVEDAPQMVDNLCEDCRAHFVKVLEHLDAAEIPYTLDARIVRGLDYYSRTAFEFFPIAKEAEKTERQSAISAGGRYDGLVQLLGGREGVPACGFAGGIERIILSIKDSAISIPEPINPDVFLAQIGDSARKKSLKLLEDLRSAGLRVRANLSKSSLSNQLATAAKLNVKFTLILGQKEVIDSTILIRDMSSGSQEIIDVKKIVSEINKRLLKLKQENG